MITLTEEQQNAHDGVIDWVNNFYNESNHKQFISVSGLAGTGKTTLIKFVAETLRTEKGHSIAFATYTGKASIVLRDKMDYIGVYDKISTIHSLIYTPIVDDNGDIVGWSKKPSIDQSIIIIDEGSMVNKDIWDDLLSYRLPIIVFGDHGQLPPIGEANFSLMKKPDIILKRIHRQALDNPIIKVSLYARKYGRLPDNASFKEYRAVDWINKKTRDLIESYNIDDQNTQILCGMNATRVKINHIIRSSNDINRSEPMIGEKLICLRNNRDEFIMNGQMGTIADIKVYSEDLFKIYAILDGQSNLTQTFYAYKNSFGKVKYDTVMLEANERRIKYQLPEGRKIVNLFDFGYCISVHKAQGSEFQNLILFDERNYYQSDEDYARWLYTGLTRAKETVVVIKNFY